MRIAQVLAAASVLTLIVAPLEASARERSARIVGARGGQGQITRSVTPGERSVSRDWTGPNGKTRSVDRTATKTAPGQWEVNREVTGRNGETRVQTGTASVTKTETGRTITGSGSGPNGTGAFERSVSTVGGVRTVEGTATGSNGGVRTVDRVWDSNTGTMTGDRTLTGPNGATRNVDVTAAKDGDKITYERTVTGPNGDVRTNTGEVVVTH
jgi:hypothetical protein